MGGSSSWMLWFVELGVSSFRCFGRPSRICGDEGTKAGKSAASLVLVS